ncbi:hypothetical protein [Asticcacaulis sp. AND118]|uniref:hypothetical protein n=1 Tax=Asticcacaulis sp. AND118 TaxID=2840468 RepID=UPI001CFF9854|nr:hypothetical protein [Asticcacaulis sp. AND118]UDF04521.1 hypothetical protein LH365_05655 [Asticcacaulis sp. AND118]
MTINHGPISSNGTNYSLHHLQPFRIILQGHARDGTDLILRLSFNSHVYSTAHDAASLECVILDKGGHSRTFCTVRYSLSRRLPGICEALILNNDYTWQSTDRNRVNNLAMCESPLQSGMKYLIVYSVFPSRRPDIHLEFNVKSAYEKTIDATRIKNRQKIRQILKQSYFNNRPIP